MGCGIRDRLVTAELGVGLVEFGDFEDEGLAGFVHATEFYFSAFAAEFQHYTVKRVDRGQIPEVGK